VFFMKVRPLFFFLPLSRDPIHRESSLSRPTSSFPLLSTKDIPSPLPFFLGVPCWAVPRRLFPLFHASAVESPLFFLSPCWRRCSVSELEQTPFFRYAGDGLRSVLWWWSGPYRTPEIAFFRRGEAFFSSQPDDDYASSSFLIVPPSDKENLSWISPPFLFDKLDNETWKSRGPLFLRNANVARPRRCLSEGAPDV